MSRFFRHVVERTLAGEADQLKEYSVGVEVFDRDDKYDPRLDSIVRVEAGRLRSRLDEHYNGEGAASPIRISLPRGGYVAQFERRVEPLAPAPVPAPAVAEKRRTWAAWPLTAGLICAVAAMVVSLGGWNRTPPKSGPAIAVLAFEPWSSTADDAAIAARITESVTTELARLGTVGVSSHTSAMQFAGVRKPLREIAATLNANYILEASLERESDGLLVTTRIVSAETDRKIWVADYRGAADDIRGISQRIAFDVSAELLRRAR
jgi:adenylate cyclase